MARRWTIWLWREDRDEYCGGGIHCLKLDEDADARGKAEKPSVSREEPWVWHDPCDYPRARWRWSKNHHGALPFDPDSIRAHAVHPGGRAFSVSVHSYFYLDDDRGKGTFSYNTEDGQWTRHGSWELPFGGQAHYDEGLAAWVGLGLRVELQNVCIEFFFPMIRARC